MMVDITEVSAIVAAAGVMVGVVYYVLDIRHQARTRQTDLVMRLYATFSSNEFQDAWAKVRKRAKEFESIDDIFDFEEKVGGFGKSIKCACSLRGSAFSFKGKL